MRIGLFGLFIILLLLKLLGFIAISWWWVFAPLILSVVLGVLLFVGLIKLALGK